MRTTLASLALLAVVLAGCSDARDDSATSADTDDSGGAYEPGDGAAAGGGDTDDSGESGDSRDAVTRGSTVDLDAVPIAAVDRRIVYTGTSSAEVDDVGAAVRAARDAATVEGGYVFTQDLAADRGRLVLKVPVDRFDAVFDAVVAIGEVVDSQIEAEDVTERFVDLESRQATLATSIERIRGFLAQTTNVDEISRLESELTNREAEHDVIAGQLRVLRDRTTYGTITASFHVPADQDLAGSGKEDDAGGPPGFRAGLSAGWDAIATVAGVVATVGGFVLPFVPLLVLAAALAWWVRRRRPVSPVA
jgi:hypothetical protein